MACPPSFAVIVPAYNAASTLQATIASLLEQTAVPHEIIVIDDGSTDATGEIAASYGPPVRVLTQPNGGTASARNHGMREATADVIAFLDADDLYTRDRLERIGGKFREEPELEAVATDAIMEYDDSSKLVSTWWPPGANRQRLDAAAPIIFCTLALRRDLVEVVGDFNSRYEILEDLEYWYRIGCRRHRVGYVPDASYRYRIHAGSKTDRRRRLDIHREFVEINLRFALGPRTPLPLRPRLGMRALRHVRHGLVAALGRS
jgi:glycosyltransferase involved in cell wall biosynthesis